MTAEAKPGRDSRWAPVGYRGLLLRGKVLLLIGALALFLGTMAVLAQHWALCTSLDWVAGASPSAGDAGSAGTGVAYVLTRDAVDQVSSRMGILISGTMALSALLVLGIASFVVRRVSAPLRQLIQSVNEVAVGNPDPVIDVGRRVNCWEILNCGRTDCIGYMNLDEHCWYLDGTPCEGYQPSFPEKLEGCRHCVVFREHRGDEVQQLVDAFKHMLGVLRNSREELLRSGDFQQRMIRNSYNGVIATDTVGQITIFNRAAEEMLDISREEVIGKLNWRAFLDPSLVHDLEQPLSYERVRRVRGFRLRESVIHKLGGEPIDILLSGISLFDRGIHVGKVFFFLDVREVKGLREELIRSERLAATGQAAAGISHSVKNILDGFRGGAYVYEQGRRKNDQAKMDKGWDMVDRNIEIISRLVMDLLNFAKDRPPEYEEVDPRALIDQTIASLGLGSSERVSLRVEVAPEAGTVDLDPHAFQQCLGDLIRNAHEAIPRDRPGEVIVSFQVKGERAVFRVSDDGAGMSAETMERVRGGLYSTKGSKGTGLGLLVIQKIVKEHGGTLEMESREGVGSSLSIEIPLRRPAGQEPGGR